MQKFKNWIALISLIGLLVVGIHWKENIQQVAAQNFNGGDVFWTVNNIRAMYGLEPYVYREDLAQLAQSHAEYMASIQKLTHTRADGSQPNVTSENVALGPINNAIRAWMDSQPHKDTLLAWSKGYAGAGVALSANGYIYICFAMNRMPDAVKTPIYDPYPPPATPDPNAPTLAPGQATPTFAAVSQLIKPVVAATPDQQGYIYHKVESGQTLWAIHQEYGTAMERIIGLNNLPANNPIIYEGQTLLVDIVDPPEPTPSASPTRVASPTATATAKPTETPVPTVTSIVAVEDPEPPESEPTASNAGWWLLISTGLLGAGTIYHFRDRLKWKLLRLKGNQ